MEASHILVGSQRYTYTSTLFLMPVTMKSLLSYSNSGSELSGPCEGCYFLHSFVKHFLHPWLSHKKAYQFELLLRLIELTCQWPDNGSFELEYLKTSFLQTSQPKKLSYLYLWKDQIKTWIQGGTSLVVLWVRLFTPNAEAWV